MKNDVPKMKPKSKNGCIIMVMAAVKGRKLEPTICPICNHDCGKRLTKFDDHLRTKHETTPQDLWNKINGGSVQCGCGCGKQTLWLGWKHGYGRFLKGHNANLDATILECCGPTDGGCLCPFLNPFVILFSQTLCPTFLTS